MANATKMATTRTQVFRRVEGSENIEWLLLGCGDDYTGSGTDNRVFAGRATTDRSDHDGYESNYGGEAYFQHVQKSPGYGPEPL